MGAAGPEALGLIAGMGSFPVDIARSARQRGRSVVAVAFHEHTDPRIEAVATTVTWLYPGEVGAVVAALRSAGVRDAVMAGKVPKAALDARPQALRLDGDAREILRGLCDRGDASLLAAVAEHLERRGIHLLAQAELVPELLAGEGLLGCTRPTAAQRADIAFAWPIAKRVAGLDIGQTVVVKDRCVLAPRHLHRAREVARIARGARGRAELGRHRGSSERAARLVERVVAARALKGRD